MENVITKLVDHLKGQERSLPPHSQHNFLILHQPRRSVRTILYGRDNFHLECWIFRGGHHDLDHGRLDQWVGSLQSKNVESNIINFIFILRFDIQNVHQKLLKSDSIFDCWVTKCLVSFSDSNTFLPSEKISGPKNLMLLIVGFEIKRQFNVNLSNKRYLVEIKIYIKKDIFYKLKMTKQAFFTNFSWFS